MVRQFAFATVLVAFSSLAVFAADPWIGKEVYFKSGAKAKMGDSEINIQLLPVPATVGDVKGDWLSIGRAWVHKDDVFLPEQALDYWADQIRKKPSAAHNWNNRGAVWNDSGEFENAIKDLTEAIRLNPEFAPAYANRGYSWSMKGDFDNALKDYTRAMKLNLSDTDSYAAAAWLRATCPDAACRDGSRAVTNATTACILSAWTDSSNIDTLAAAYAELGDFSSAIKWQEKAIELAIEDSNKADMRLRLDLYKNDKPYRETPNK
jgi:tetratricopeptide (TPR) repeat protein